MHLLRGPILVIFTVIRCVTATSHAKHVPSSILQADRQVNQIKALCNTKPRSCDGPILRTWDSARDAGGALGINPKEIELCLMGRLIDAGSYRWRYADDAAVPLLATEGTSVPLDAVTAVSTGGVTSHRNMPPHDVEITLQQPLRRVINNRTKLLYSEMAKTGSGTLRNILPLVQPDCIPSAGWSAGPKKHGPEQFGGCYKETGPDSTPSKADARTFYIIASVREPCDWYISYFAWNKDSILALPSKAFARKFIKRLTGKSHESENHVNVGQGATNYFIEKYHTGGRKGAATLVPRVDCWVHVDDFATTLRRCLGAFESQGGRVAWDAAPLRAVLNPVDPLEQTDNSSNCAEMKRRKCGSKNTPGTQLLHHRPCADYFDDNATKALVEQVDAPLYHAFGWAGCCAGAPKRRLS